MSGAKLIYIDTVVRNVKRKGVVREVSRPVYTMAVQAGFKMFATGGIVGPTVDDIADVEELDDGHYLVSFDEDAIVTVEGLRPSRRNPDMMNLRTCTNIRFAMRPDAPWSELRAKYRDENGDPVRVLHDRPSTLPYQRRILAALLNDEEEPLYVPGGLRYARAYCADAYGEGAETIIPAPPRGWRPGNEKYPTVWDIPWFFIVGADEIDDLLESLSARE